MGVGKEVGSVDRASGRGRGVTLGHVRFLARLPARNRAMDSEIPFFPAPGFLRRTILAMERLNKYLAHAGIGSRRHCDTLIAAGRVKVNGVRVSDLGLKIDPDAHQISVDDHAVRSEKPVYWVVHKPVGYLSTNSDPAGRPRAVDLLPHVDQRVYTVGRLDEGSEGLLLMTNDGELAFHLMHPRFGIPKTYLVLVAGNPTAQDIQKLLDGVWLSEGKVRAKNVRRMKPQGNSTWLRIVLTEGKNREIRRMLAQLGHKVMRLRRVAIGPIKLDRLPKGKARRLSEAELTDLRNWVTTSQERIAKARQRATDPESPVADASKPGTTGSGSTPARPTKPLNSNPRPTKPFPTGSRSTDPRPPKKDPTKFRTSKPDPTEPYPARPGKSESPKKGPRATKPRAATTHSDEPHAAKPRAARPGKFGQRPTKPVTPGRRRPTRES